MRVRVVTPPAVEPVTPDELITYLRLDDDTDPESLTLLIAAARGHAEAYTRRSFITQTLEAVLALPAERRLAAEPVVLPRPPLVSVSSVALGDETPLAESDYRVDAPAGTVAPITRGEWAPGTTLTVTYVAGYGSAAASVPPAIRLAIARIAATLSENREDVITGTISSEIPLNARQLLDPFRVLNL